MHIFPGMTQEKMFEIVDGDDDDDDHDDYGRRRMGILTAQVSLKK